jgi:hypothetical protein
VNLLYSAILWAAAGGIVMGVTGALLRLPVKYCASLGVAAGIIGTLAGEYLWS